MYLYIYVYVYVYIYIYIYTHILEFPIFHVSPSESVPFWNPKKARACAMSKSMGFVSSEAHGLNMFKQCCFLMFFVFSCLFEGM